MIDETGVLRTYLLSQTALTALTGQRIWGMRTYPIVGYLPSQGQALVFRSRGTGLVDYSGAMITTSWQFKGYGETPEKADELHRTLFDVLQEAKTGGMWRAMVEPGGGPLEEPGQRWAYVLSFWSTMMQVSFVPA